MMERISRRLSSFAYSKGLVRQYAMGADNPHVGDARPAQEGRHGLGARHD